MGLTILCEIFLAFNLNDGIFDIILLVPQNIVMGLNNVMSSSCRSLVSVKNQTFILCPKPMQVSLNLSLRFLNLVPLPPSVSHFGHGTPHYIKLQGIGGLVKLSIVSIMKSKHQTPLKKPSQVQTLIWRGPKASHNIETTSIHILPHNVAIFKP